MRPMPLRLLLLPLLVLGAAGCRPGTLQDDTHTEAAASVQVLDAAPSDWAALAGRSVRVEAPLTVNGTWRLQDGEVVVAFDGRLPAPTEVAAPGAAAKRVAEDNADRRLTLVLDAQAQAFAPRADAPLRAGSLLHGVEGVVDAAEPARLRLTAVPRLIEQAPRPPVPQVAGDLRIAALNLLNLFNGDGHGGGFPTARGAESVEDYRRQQARLVETVTALDADIVALMEVENDGFGPDAALVQFARAIAEASGQDWRVVDAGAGPGTDLIRVALIYRGDRVRLRGTAATLLDGPFARHSRAPLAQAFVPVSAEGRDQGEAFVVAVNHFKSKGGCGSAEGADADQGDGQACWNAARVDSARRLDAWLRDDPTGAGSARTLIVGDLNAYAMEEPIALLTRAGWQDALPAVPEAEPAFHYSYVFDAQAGRLDHALVSPALASHLRDAAFWRVNADEPRWFAYDRCPPGTACDGPWAGSDHDPLLLGFDLREAP